MTISYNWLKEYLPAGDAAITAQLEPEKLSAILTSIGLEVESLEKYESLKGGLQGLVIGEVLTCDKHPDADKLKITKVHIGEEEPLQIVCGASNVAIGQKVVVATIGATIYPTGGEPVTMKKAKIRGVESQGMICAEDEIGLSENHEGIMILPAETMAGQKAASYFKPYEDFIFEIGLTPNRMDAMSHLGVAKDVCAYLSHHSRKTVSVKYPFKNNFKADNHDLPIQVVIENKTACRRYAGISIKNVTIADSPVWLQQKLAAIGLRPINNIVDITNFILHETGQPLHAFDTTKINGGKIVVKNLPEGTPFITLDEKERKLFADDLLICNESEAMCIAGVYGGLHSGVTNTTKNIFLESAWFNPIAIRKTSVRNGLRTDAATRFEKGVDISTTVQVLKRAAVMIKEIAGGELASDIVDIYPEPISKTEVVLTFHYLKKLSGKNYHSDAVKNILTGLGFEIIKEGYDDIRVAVPFSKPDITLPADIVEEIMRIDGLDNVEIPSAITITPSIESLGHEAAYKEKIADFLAGIGFNEIFTNSITNAAYYTEETLKHSVKMINSLSAELNIMRPSMLETGLESIAHNLNRRNSDLLFFEFGKTYAVSAENKYLEQQNLAILITGEKTLNGWKSKSEKTDFYFAKSIYNNITTLCGLHHPSYTVSVNKNTDYGCDVKIKNQSVAFIGSLNKKCLQKFDIKQPVYFIDVNWDVLIALSKKETITYSEIPKFPSVQRDIAIVVDKNMAYESIEKATYAAKVSKLTSLNLFDIFESEKLGENKKSMAINFSFLDEEKTLTDKEIDAMMAKIIASYQKDLMAEVRK